MHAELIDKRITVMGLGRFGGGTGLTRWLAAQGADVLVTDLEPADRLVEPLHAIADLVESGQVSLRIGEHNVSDFTTCDAIIANPAVPKPWDNRFLRAAHAAGVPVSTEIRLLTERIDRSRTIGVTGSAGKSTTAAMIHHILLNNGPRAWLGGNIGGTLLNDLARVRPEDWFVLELSSAMLYWLGEGMGFAGARGWSPRVAVLTNILPNHIDWHGSFEHYRESKLNIFRWQDSKVGDARVTDDMIAADAPTAPLRIPGAHNQRNAQMAIAAAEIAVGVDRHLAAQSLATFRGLPHRLQLVAERDGTRFFNDSKSTTPQATALAVASFDEPSRIHLIAGGYDKGSDLSPIAQLASRLAGMYTVGATGRALAQAAVGGSAEYCGDVEVAVERALARMNRGDILLLSPGCASWDQFTNYEQRGDAFTNLVAGLSVPMTAT